MTKKTIAIAASMFVAILLLCYAFYAAVIMGGLWVLMKVFNLGC